MVLHHVVTIYLFAFMYLNNLWESGCTIIILHDISDFWIAACKAFSETKWTKHTVYLFVPNMLIWFYWRLCVLPFAVWKYWNRKINKEFDTFKPFFCYLLLCLWFLH